MQNSPFFSIVIPVYNEAENIEPMVREIQAAFRGRPEACEVIFVDDASTDDTPAVLQRLTLETGIVRSLRHRRNFGQSAAVASGFQSARGEWIGTLDGDGQNDPADLPHMLDEARRLGVDCVTGGARQAPGQFHPQVLFARRQPLPRLDHRRPRSRQRLRRARRARTLRRRTARLQRPAPLHAHAAEAEGLSRRRVSGEPPAAPARRVEVRRAQSTLARHPRLFWRALVRRPGRADGPCGPDSEPGAMSHAGPDAGHHAEGMPDGPEDDIEIESVAPGFSKELRRLLILLAGATAVFFPVLLHAHRRDHPRHPQAAHLPRRRRFLGGSHLYRPW
ncbi:MAG: glycosyltransferase family 2 protein [Rhodocyclaceae bacterium]|nr:glycosyltransferase family 2 protein [Rhodocyclaceae bacterium]